jgi:PGF-CTERM protein
MNLKPVGVVLLLALVILVGVPESFARPQYLTSLSTVYGDGSCGTCHVRASGGGARNSYGTLFENQPNYNNDPIAALKVIGAPPTATATTPSATLTATPSLTPEITKEIPGEKETQEETQTQEETETPAETAASAVTTVMAARTPTTPGFGIVAAIVGLFACAFLARRQNK